MNIFSKTASRAAVLFCLLLCLSAIPGCQNDDDDAAGCLGLEGSYAPGSTTPDCLNLGDAYGNDRTFRIYVPDDYDANQTTPLMLMFHGANGNGRQMEMYISRMNDIAKKNGFVTVYPDAWGDPATWNIDYPGGSSWQHDEIDDVGFVGKLLDHLGQKLNVDSHAVYASGFSNGAMFALALACRMPERIAAVAPVAGVDATAGCNPDRPTSVLLIHGDKDGFQPWEGGYGCGEAGLDHSSVPDTFDRWADRNGCSRDEQEVFAAGDGICSKKLGCPEGVDVILCRIEGGGHSWPGGPVIPEGLPGDCPGDGGQSTTFPADETIWNFFHTHTKG